MKDSHLKILSFRETSAEILFLEKILKNWYKRETLRKTYGTNLICINNKAIVTQDEADFLRHFFLKRLHCWEILKQAEIWNGKPAPSRVIIDLV